MKTPNINSFPLKLSKSATATPSSSRKKRIWHTNMKDINLNDLPYSPGLTWKNALEETHYNDNDNDNYNGDGHTESSHLKHNRVARSSTCRYIPESLKGNRHPGGILKQQQQTKKSSVVRRLFGGDSKEEKDLKLRFELEGAIAERNMAGRRKVNFGGSERVGAATTTMLRNFKPSATKMVGEDDTLQNSDHLDGKAKNIGNNNNNNDNNNNKNYDKTTYGFFTPQQRKTTRHRRSIDEEIDYEIDIIGNIPDPTDFAIYESQPSSPTAMAPRDLDASNEKGNLTTDDHDNHIAMKKPLSTIILNNKTTTTTTNNDNNNNNNGDTYEIDILGSIPDPPKGYYYHTDKENTDIFAGKQLPKTSTGKSGVSSDIIGGYSVYSEDCEYEIDMDYHNSNNNEDIEEGEIPESQYNVKHISPSSVAEHLKTLTFLSHHRTIVDINLLPLSDAIINKLQPIGGEAVYDEEENCYILRSEGMGWVAVDGGFGWYVVLTRRDGVGEVLGDVRGAFMAGSGVKWMPL